MSRTFLSLCVCVIVAAAPSGAAPQERTRTIYVSAVDNKNVPVADLTAADFTIKEEGKVQAVTTAAVATAPMQITMMVDNGGVGLASIRESLAAFATRVRERSEIAIITTAGRNLTVLEPTSDHQRVFEGVNRVLATNATGAYLLDGIMGVTKTLMARNAPRPVILLIALPGAEHSNASANDVLASLRDSRAHLYVVELTTSRPRFNSEAGDDLARRNSVLENGPKQSGGRLEQVVAATGLPNVVGGIADELMGQYAITYTAPAGGPANPRLSVETSRRGVRIRAPQRVANGPGIAR